MQFDLVVIGAGPGGYVGAIRGAQLGMKVALIEKRKHLGGTCLNVGCIPTKSLLESAKTWTKLTHIEELGFSAGKPEYQWDKILGRKNGVVDSQRKGLQFLMKKNKIQVFEGTGKLESKTSVSVEDSSGKKQTLSTKFVLLAMGSKVRELTFAVPNHKTILTSDSILDIPKVPESLCIVGGGVVGMEFASLFGRFGSKVTVVELGPQILPSEDAETVKEFARHVKKQNVTIKTKTKLKSLEDKGDHVMVTTEGSQPEKFDRVLLSIGREPVTKDIGLEKNGVVLEGATVKVDAHYRTTVPNIFAIGDILATPALAHTASAEALHAVEIMNNKSLEPINYLNNPNAVYSYPEVASVGYTEEALKAKGIEYKSGKFPFSPIAKARIENATEGFIKILFEPKYNEILGVHIVGARATELIAEYTLGKALELTVDDIAHTIHPHPTISETVMEAAHASIGAAIHT